MATRAYVGSHAVTYEKDQWVFDDTNMQATYEELLERSCQCCHKRFIRCSVCQEIHDPCLGHLAGVTSACCGHGMLPAYTVLEQ